MVDPALIDPGARYKEKDRRPDPHQKFLKTLKKAETFHEQIQMTCHSDTYAYYGADEQQRSIPKVIWRTNESLAQFTDDDILNAQRLSAEMEGKTEVMIKGKKVVFTLDTKPRERKVRETVRYLLLPGAPWESWKASRTCSCSRDSTTR
jgi:hypothetical protein